MKPALILILSSIPLFAFLTNLPLAFSNDIEQVLDTDNKPIFPGGTYYIIPAIRGPPGGGLGLGKAGNLDCPSTILQVYSEVYRGLPIKFEIPGISPGIIFTGTPLNIKFNIDGPPCARSTEWKVYVDKKIEKAYVAIGDPDIHEDESTVSGTFNIQRYGLGPFGYKLVFCITGSPTCLDIGRFDAKNENGRRLVLTEHEPFEVVFVDASKFDGIIKSVV